MGHDHEAIYWDKVAYQFVSSPHGPDSPSNLTASQFRTIIGEFSTLKHLRVRVSLDELMLADEDNPDVEQIKNRKTQLFEGCAPGAGQALQTLTINQLPGDAIQLL